MMTHIETIKSGIKNNITSNEIVRKVFLTYPTKAFIGYEEKQYEILNDISIHFNIPIMSIQVVGSAKTGHSSYKKTTFKSGFSDLDIAIVDTGLFYKYMEIVFKETKGYSDMSKFPRKKGNSSEKSYLKYISKGIFRPDMMPSCDARAEWRKYFGALSKKHWDLFKSINAGLYLSQTFFEYKLSRVIKDFNEYEVI